MLTWKLGLGHSDMLRRQITEPFFPYFFCLLALPGGCWERGQQRDFAATAYLYRAMAQYDLSAAQTPRAGAEPANHSFLPPTWRNRLGMPWSVPRPEHCKVGSDSLDLPLMKWSSGAPPGICHVLALCA
eukprot:gnl/TRDRNA2_/TRDRNA2_177458_c1_seq3.p1 gnl/TRDRNA2_/TRDRNA2_177458_c1~~gnl/TRDRNA2_/TRDRNA2_177458_c1_seq3.p1  ORF type:complete len:129 (-),score=0.48 gnl/TRDRNA2_/TRDRNA2_177458_c1_seq3:424-810(-)